MANGPIVSSESELLILVDQDDNTVGFLDKAACHDGKGLLHRAFSVFILNSQGEILLQRRSLGKRLWGGFWSNSCCSHPRKGESVVDAAKRRCLEELGIKVDLRFLYKFSYEAEFDSTGSENELCHVLVGHSEMDPSINRNEILEWRWISRKDLDEELLYQGANYTPWLKMEWEAINRDHVDQISR